MSNESITVDDFTRCILYRYDLLHTQQSCSENQKSMQWDNGYKDMN